MEKWKGRVALVTGGSAGIGAALVKQLLGYGVRVAACSIDVEVIQGMCESLTDLPGELLPIKCDLTSEEQIINMFKVIRDKYGRLDILVNNAGLGKPATLLTGTTSQWTEMFKLNVLGTSICTREGFKLMEEGGADDCHIISLHSFTGHRQIKSESNFYGMTKSALLAHTEGVRRELRERGSNIRISAISPGLVITDFQKSMYGSEVDKKKDDFQTTAFKAMEADDIAQGIIYMLSCPPHVQVHDILIRPTQQIP